MPEERKRLKQKTRCPHSEERNQTHIHPLAQKLTPNGSKPKHETLELLEENIGGAPHDTGEGTDFLSRTQEFCSRINAAIDKWDFIKLRRFCTTKETIGEEEAHEVAENLCQTYI